MVVSVVMKNKIKIKNKSLIVINLFWFAVIAFLSYRMPMMVDDYVHINSFATGDRITSISMIPDSVATYYMTWGGRALSMFFIQLIAGDPYVDRAEKTSLKDLVSSFMKKNETVEPEEISKS